MTIETTSPERRSGTVALIGRPNAGKSTLLNRVVGVKLSIVSDKPQTTRHRITGVLTEERGQAVFVDTPGVHRPHHRMNQRMMETTRAALASVDVVALLLDVSEPIGGGDRFVLDLVRDVAAPVVLLLNKVDRVSKPRLLPLIDDLRRERDFADIIPVSATRGDNVEAFLDSVFRLLPLAEPTLEGDALTDRSMRFLAAERVREQLLRRTREELPYSLAVAIESWEEPEDDRQSLRIEAVILVDKENHKPMVIGKQGSLLKAAGTAARLEIEELLGRRVNLRLWVNVRPDWRDQPATLDSLEIAPS